MVARNIFPIQFEGVIIGKPILDSHNAFPDIGVRFVEWMEIMVILINFQGRRSVPAYFIYPLLTLCSFHMIVYWIVMKNKSSELTRLD